MLKQKGFTLIELIVVIVILGILAATALPKFVDLTGDAQKAAVQGFTGAINGGDSINFSTYLARRTVSDLSVATAGVQDTTGGCTVSYTHLDVYKRQPHDLAASKLAAGREKDWLFVQVMLRHNSVGADTLEERIKLLPIPAARNERLKALSLIHI